MTTDSAAAPVAQPIRRFNRFYSRIIGGLARTYLDTPYSLQEARVIHEVAAAPGSTAKDICRRAGFDPGHLSRIIARLESNGILKRRPSKNDRRARELTLTAQGKHFYADMSRRADQQAHGLVAHLSQADQRRLVEAMTTIERLLDPDTPPPPVVIQEARLGDLGWCFHRHAVVYNQDFNYSPLFETYVAKGLPPFLEHHDPARDRLWTARRDGAPVGWIAIQHSRDRPGWAQLRWFLLERDARGQGLGKALLDEAIAFARQSQYHGIQLWTVSDLPAARTLYERAGFRLAEQHQQPCPWAPWAHQQRWELPLDPGPGQETGP